MGDDLQTWRVRIGLYRHGKARESKPRDHTRRRTRKRTRKRTGSKSEHVTTTDDTCTRDSSKSVAFLPLLVRMCLLILLAVCLSVEINPGPNQQGSPKTPQKSTTSRLALTPKKSPVAVVASKALRRANRPMDNPVATRSTSRTLHIIPEKKRSRQDWVHAEDIALVTFVRKHQIKNNLPLDKWPLPDIKNPFWNSLRSHIVKKSNTEPRTAISLKSRLSKFYKNKTVSQVLDEYKLPSIHPSTNPEREPLPDVSSLSPESKVDLALNALEHCSPSHLKLFVQQLMLQQEDVTTLHSLADTAFNELALRHGIDTYPTDFASKSSKAMEKLQQLNKPNVLYKFAHCIAEERPGSQESLMPLTRMPFGLIEHQIEFFWHVCTNKIEMPDDYLQWYIMMETEFGSRFSKLFRGPAWSGCAKEDINYSLKAKVNVAAVSHRTVTKELANSPFTTSSKLQVAAMEKLKEANPEGRFWIKLDATDIRPALQESVRGEWNGDCDLLDGTLEKLREVYDNRRSIIKGQLSDVEESVKLFQDDTSYLQERLEGAVKIYTNKSAQRTSAEKLKELNWEVVELSNLLGIAQNFEQKYSALRTVGIQRARQVHRGLEEELLDYTRHLFKKKRQPAATHVLIIMLSDEKRDKKPYALPVQYIAYQSIKDDYIRKLTKAIKQQMREMNMTCLGTVTDGEFSTLRTRDSEGQPIHIVEVLKQSREEVQYKSAPMLKQILAGDTPSAVPAEVITKLVNLQRTMPWNEALKVVRSDTVPEGYNPLSWRLYTPETELDMLRSIVCTYVFRDKIRDLQNKGINLNDFYYVPQVDNITGRVHHEREDHNHILKRVAKHVREGGVPGVNLLRFQEAMKAGKLTEAALYGSRKQSVGDAERLLSFGVADFFREKGYLTEEKFVRMVARWHEASDGRGLSQRQRQEANKAMLDFITSHMIPWHESTPGLQFMDINTRFKGLCGFSRESVIGITTNIESQEHRRAENEEFGEEHPRAGTTDDVECFFSLLHRITRGIHVTLKEFKFWFQKLVFQFINRTDPSLPYYVWTVSDRYSMEEQPSFDEIPAEEMSDTGELMTRLHCLRIRSREQSGVAPGRSSLPTTHSRSIRQSNFMAPVPLPAVPAEMQQNVQGLLNTPLDPP